MGTQGPEPGCYVDSHWGQYAIARAVQVAADLGWPGAKTKDEHELTALDYAAIHLDSMGPSTRPGVDVDEFEQLVGACDEAEEWLNEHRAPEGYAWGWNDGDFGLYALEDEDA